jgi:queuine tRNA-ribosyltransferase
MEVQAALGSEIVMVFDECPPGDAGHERTKQSLELTLRWAKRSKDRFHELQTVRSSSFSLPPSIVEPSDYAEQAKACTLSGKQALFGIIQGAGHLDLRDESLIRTAEIGFDGYAIGGLSVGEEKPVMYGVLDHIADKMPADAPRYLMGVGTPEDLVEAVSRGVDMFDCVMPTRNGRTGGVFTWQGKLNIRNAQHATDDSPLDSDCPCSVCKRYSRAYLRHLYQAGEMLAATLISHHNLAFYLDLMRRVREEIKAGSFENFRLEFLDRVKNSEK